MELDTSTGTLNFRILIHGPDGATKARNLAGLQEALPRDEVSAISTLHASGDRVMSFVHRPRGMERRGFHCGFHYMVAPGAVKAPALERLMIQAADAVVFLPQREDPAGASSRSCFEALLRDARSESAKRSIPLFALDYCDALDRSSTASMFRTRERVQILASPGDTPAAILDVHARVRSEVLRSFDGLSRERVRELEQRRSTAKSPLRLVRGSRLPLLLGAAFGVAGIALLAWWLAGQL